MYIPILCCALQQQVGVHVYTYTVLCTVAAGWCTCIYLYCVVHCSSRLVYMYIPILCCALQQQVGVHVPILCCALQQQVGELKDVIRTLEIDLREERRTLQVNQVQSKSVQSRMVQLDKVQVCLSVHSRQLYFKSCFVHGVMHE